MTSKADIQGGPVPGRYDPHPTFSLPGSSIQRGFDALAGLIRLSLEGGTRLVAVDGFGGVAWDELEARLARSLTDAGVSPVWVRTREAMLPEASIARLVEPYLGGADPLFGTRYPGGLGDLYDTEALERTVAGVPIDHPTVVVGEGAAIVPGIQLLVYVDVPKDEIQRRMGDDTFRNLGVETGADPKEQYKRAYFVDWPMLNRHKCSLVDRVDVVVDAQRTESPTIVSGDALRRGLDQMTTSCVRPRPWFAPGPWGGQWMRRNFPGLPEGAPNFAWSFELIAPENGLVFESAGETLEVSFDWLMYRDAEAVLGSAADRFGHDFPIRFDFLDTVEGGNLSIQCHPSPEYALEHFGEPFTQDETYYIVECEPSARVFLGLQEGADADEFRQALQRSARDGSEVDVDRFVSSVESRRHDLYLIPHGTVHSAGQGNLVLEISATPYIFTFKMYDWLRRGLDGGMRPLNIERAWDNLDLTRTAGYAREHLVSRPRTLASGDDWRVEQLPTHPVHFYDVHRLEFRSTLSVETDGRCHLLNLVEGESIVVETANGHRRRVTFAETVLIPAAAGSYRLANEGGGICRMVKAFVR